MSAAHPPVIIRMARPDELAWVNQQYAEAGIIPCGPGDRVAVAEAGGVRAGVGRLSPAEGRSCELGGIWVDDAFRGRGVAHRLVSWLLAQPQYDTVYCLPFAELEALFAAHGFHRTEDAPEDVMVKHQWCSERYEKPVLLMRCLKPVHEVVIVGSGFAGICTAVKLLLSGVHNFVMLEKDEEPGGTWRANDYPGAACDIPSHLYSFSFAPRSDWSRRYPGQAELLEYTRSVIADFGLAAHIRTRTEFLGAAFNYVGGYWAVNTSRGQLTCKSLVSAVGALSRPMVPRLRGIEHFKGKQFHSAQWDHSYDLRGKRVAVVGTGASAIQFIPEIAPLVEQLDVYQRSAPWIIARRDGEFGTLARSLLGFEPLRLAYRALIYATNEARLLAFTRLRAAMRLAQWSARRHMRRQLGKRADLVAKLTPDYAMGCKRILVHNDFYPALTRPNVALLTEGIREVRAYGIVTAKGELRPVDAIIYATGFDVQHVLGKADIRGRDGHSLLEASSGGLQAYKGATVAGFPNFFMVTGPNTGLGHNSMIYMIEAGADYVVDAVRRIREDDLHSVEVRRGVQNLYNFRLQKRLARTVWNSGCKSWYLGGGTRRNYVLWPGFSFSYRRITRRFDLDAYLARPADQA